MAGLSEKTEFKGFNRTLCTMGKTHSQFAEVGGNGRGGGVLAWLSVLPFEYPMV